MKNRILKALVLAGGYDQIALISELKKRGYFVILADYFENPPARKYADQFAQISTLDEEKIYDVGKNENVDLVITACTDQALLTAANVSERLGLPFYISGEQARNVTNKYYMKQKFKEYGIASPEYTMLEYMKEDELQTLTKFPYVVKPCDCNSSKGVIKTENMHELVGAVEKAFQLSRSKKVVVEQYVSGAEISIDVWIHNAKPQVLAVSETKKMNAEKGVFTIYQSKYPMELTDRTEQEIRKIALQICEAFQLKNGPMLIQAVLQNEKVYVLEFSARMGGGSKYKFIQSVCGINIMEQYVNFVIDHDSSNIMPSPSPLYYEMDYIYAYPGIIDKISGVDDLKKRNIIEAVFYYKTMESEITQKLVSGDRVMGVLIGADTPKKLLEKRQEMLNNVKIIDKNGKDIMYRECFLRTMETR